MVAYAHLNFWEDTRPHIDLDLCFVSFVSRPHTIGIWFMVTDGVVVYQVSYMNYVCDSETVEGVMTEVQVVAMAEGEMGIAYDAHITLTSEGLDSVVFSRG